MGWQACWQGAAITAGAGGSTDRRTGGGSTGSPAGREAEGVAGEGRGEAGEASC